MPVLEIHDISSREALYRATQHVFAVMWFPQDPEERRRFQAAFAVKHLSMAEAHLTRVTGRRQIPPDVMPVALQSEEARDWHYSSLVLRSFFDEIGGFSALIDAQTFADYGKELKRRLQGWFSAGMILALVRRMAAHHPVLPGGPSVNKAVYMLETCKYPLTHHNSNALRKSWAHYQSVAHLCAAFYDFFLDLCDSDIPLEDMNNEVPERFTQEFGFFLGHAEAYLDFGLNFQSAGTKGATLLDPDEAWRLPDERCWPESDRVPAPLTDFLLRTAQSYRAPTPGV